MSRVGSCGSQVSSALEEVAIIASKRHSETIARCHHRHKSYLYLQLFSSLCPAAVSETCSTTRTSAAVFMSAIFWKPCKGHCVPKLLQLRISPLPSQVPPQTNHLQENAPLHVFEHTLKVLVDFGWRLKKKIQLYMARNSFLAQHKRGALVDDCFQGCEPLTERV